MTAAFHWFGTAANGEVRLLDSASVCFVHTGERLLGVSAWHVHADAVAILESDPRASCQIGGCTFDPRERVIDASEYFDLVTYDISEIQVNQAGADIHHAPEWPPQLGAAGLVLVGGWIDDLREEGDDETTHQFLHVAAYCDAVTERQIGVPLYKSSSQPWGDSPLLAGTELGGLSGGPVFQVVEDPLTKLYLVGVVFEYSPVYEIALARPLTLIKSDGRIRRSA